MFGDGKQRLAHVATAETLLRLVMNPLLNLAACYVERMLTADKA